MRSERIYGKKPKRISVEILEDGVSIGFESAFDRTTLSFESAKKLADFIITSLKKGER